MPSSHILPLLRLVFMEAADLLDAKVAQKRPNHSIHSYYDSLFCGAIAGIAAKTCIAPLERVKISFQVSSDKFTFQNAARRLVDMKSRGGFLSLWRGHSTTVMRVAPYAGLSYTFHDLAENFFKEKLQTEKLPALYKFLAGSIGGFIGTIATYPLDVLRVRLAMERSWRESVAMRGFFHGLSPTLLGIVPYAGTSWLTKQTLLEQYAQYRNPSPSISESLVINAIAGIVGQFVTYPLDVVRRRMQVGMTDPSTDMTIRRFIRELVETEGIRGLSKGFSLNIFKGPISLSISLTVYDLLRKSISF